MPDGTELAGGAPLPLAGGVRIWNPEPVIPVAFANVLITVKPAEGEAPPGVKVKTTAADAGVDTRAVSPSVTAKNVFFMSNLAPWRINLCDQAHDSLDMRALALHMFLPHVKALFTIQTGQGLHLKQLKS